MKGKKTLLQNNKKIPYSPWKYRCVDHPEPFDPIHPEPRVDDRSPVPLGTHLGGARVGVDGDGVVPRLALAAGVGVSIAVAAAGEGGGPRAGAEGAEGAGQGQAIREPKGKDFVKEKFDFDLFL